MGVLRKSMHGQHRQKHGMGPRLRGCTARTLRTAFGRGIRPQSRRAGATGAGVQMKGSVLQIRQGTDDLPCSYALGSSVLGGAERSGAWLEGPICHGVQNGVCCRGHGLGLVLRGGRLLHCQHLFQRDRANAQAVDLQHSSTRYPAGLPLGDRGLGHAEVRRQEKRPAWFSVKPIGEFHAH